jgi:thiol:disulfide interchange protein DsbD
MKTLFFLLLILLPSKSFSQVQQPVKWEAAVIGVSGDTSIIQVTAIIENNWHIYSQKQNIKKGPVATSFIFEPSNDYSLIGETHETEPLTKPEPAYSNMLVSFFEGTAVFKQKIVRKSKNSFNISLEVTNMSCSEEMCLPPEATELLVSLPEIAGSQITEAGILNDIASGTSGMTIWAIFFAGFAGGLLALLTPCVFPMLPLTVSFFTKQSKTRTKGISNAFIYAASIIVIYVSLGLIITLTLGPDALNAMASNGIVNLAFFIIFVLFAVSFFGAFEIVLPSKWLNASDRAADKGGLIGIFFMAFTLSLVSFSCTGPIIGSLLVQAAVNGDVAGPAIGMLGFAVALALPFALFAAFPGWLNSLPKSGSWLNSVKVILGFIELALALKFLSAVDLAYHWGFLTREVFIALWIVIFSLLGLYLLGKLRLPHDGEQKATSIPGLLSGIIIFGFVVYLIPGMWGAPLKLISGFPPPSFYTEGWSSQNSGIQVTDDQDIVVSDNEFQCPHNLNCFHDYAEGIAYAKQVNKPIILDFTGWSCVNCRKMEDNVWSDKTVLNLLRNEYVLVSLYVDDKTKLPDAEQFISAATGKKVKTIGNKWSDFQTVKFQTNSQPYYVIADQNGNSLVPVKGFDTSIEAYIDFLKSGITEYKSRTELLSEAL